MHEEELPQKSKKSRLELGHSHKEKDFGNVVAKHYNNLEEQGLVMRNLSCIVHMRNFNNWIKSFLLNKYIDLVKGSSLDGHRINVLDIGCGKGGDLLKWQKGRINHLICSDIAETSLEQCYDRYNHLKQKGRIFSAEFIAADSTKVKLRQHFQNPDMRIDIVSCQFALHYSFESLSQVETIIQNVSEPLRKGGYFVATIPNANHIMSSIESSKTNSIGNDIFRIEFPEDRSDCPPLFGDKYNFYLAGVVNCPEFLVHIPTLIHICKKYNLEFVYSSTFSDIYEEGVRDRETQSLLFKMKALEKYPPTPGTDLSSSIENDYHHADVYMQKYQYNDVKTLSLSEWNAISCYMAIAFRKTR